MNRLLWACGGRVEEVREILAADPSLASAALPNFWPDNYCGATALHFAAWTGQQEIAEVLLQHGADCGARDSRYGGSPAGWAAENHRNEMAEWLTAQETARLDGEK
jgi:ankyrin repeat protein